MTADFAAEELPRSPRRRILIDRQGRARPRQHIRARLKGRGRVDASRGGERRDYRGISRIYSSRRGNASPVQRRAKPLGSGIAMSHPRRGALLSSPGLCAIYSSRRIPCSAFSRSRSRPRTNRPHPARTLAITSSCYDERAPCSTRLSARYRNLVQRVPNPYRGLYGKTPAAVYEGRRDRGYHRLRDRPGPSARGETEDREECRTTFLITRKIVMRI